MCAGWVDYSSLDGSIDALRPACANIGDDFSFGEMFKKQTSLDSDRMHCLVSVDTRGMITSPGVGSKYRRVVRVIILIVYKRVPIHGLHPSTTNT